MKNEPAHITALERMDATPRTALTSRWRIVFNRPVAALRNPNVFVTNWAGINTSLVSLVPENGDHTRWIATLTTDTGSGLLDLNCGPASHYDINRIIEQPTDADGGDFGALGFGFQRAGQRHHGGEFPFHQCLAN